MCIHPHCKIIPVYNNDGESKALYCATHKKEGMIDVKNETCLVCKTRAAFNVDGETKALYCSIHKKGGMINIRGKKCLECNKRPSFNVEGEAKPLYCSIHKKEGMINVMSKRCLVCNKLPLFNVQGETKPLYCSTHKKEGMINMTSKKCLECEKQPNYNVEGETKAIYCSTHKKEGMIDVKNKTCIHHGCKKQPNYNVEGETKAIYCSAHKKEGMINVMCKTCKSEWCLTQINNTNYDEYCLFCYMNLFPDMPVSRNYKTKEYAVVEHVKSKFPSLDWIEDKRVHGGCSRRRPDLLLDLGYQVVIIEIDENQHDTYDCSCDNKRTMELSKDLGHRPIVFIRFNPDDYTSCGTNITSCWGVNKNGVCVVKQSKKAEWEDRLNILGDHISYWINPDNQTNKTVETIQLFYDIETI